MRTRRSLRVSSLLISCLMIGIGTVLTVVVLSLLPSVVGTDPHQDSGRGGGRIERVGPSPDVSTEKTQTGIVIDQESRKPPGTPTTDLPLPFVLGRLRLIDRSSSPREPSLPSPPAGAVLRDDVVREITLSDACQDASLAVHVSPPPNLRPRDLCQTRVLKWSNGQELEFSHVQGFESARTNTTAYMTVAKYRLPDGESVDISVPHGDAAYLASQSVSDIRGVPVVITQDTPAGQMYQIEFIAGGFGFFIGSINVPLDDLMPFCEALIAGHNQGR